MIDLILHFVLLGAVIFALAQATPKIHVNGFGTALIVAIVYGLINVTLGSVLKFLSFPFIFLTIGLFTLLINAVLLWITDMLVDDFEIEDATTTLIAAVVITVADIALGWVF